MINYQTTSFLIALLLIMWQHLLWLKINLNPQLDRFLSVFLVVLLILHIYQVFSTQTLLNKLNVMYRQNTKYIY